jgi:hypothetical protein
MTEFPIHVYQSPGNYVSKGYRYKLTSAADQAALDALLADGWHPTLAKAVEAAGDDAKFNRPRADWRKRKAHDAKVKAQFKREREASLAAAAKRREAVLAGKPPADEAPANVPDDNAPPTRAELEAQAVKLGLKFDGRTTDKRLLDRINEAMKEA